MVSHDNEEDADPHRVDATGKNPAVVWTPEDASHFLTAAIHEAQRPLADALKRRSVSLPALILVIAVLAGGAAAFGWALMNRLDKAEQAADGARSARDAAVSRWHDLQAKSEGLNARFAAGQEEHDRLRREYQTETERLKTEVAGGRTNEEELKRAKTEVQRHRRQNELLRNHISGLEMEKQALARQLQALKAMAMADEDPADENAPAPADPAPEPRPASGARQDADATGDGEMKESGGE